MKLIMENVRCFASRHVIPIKPLTILVGENSAGKTTLLAALSVALDPVRFPMEPSFNEPPYHLGSYDTIATYKGGRYGRAASFSLGYTTDLGSREDAVEQYAAYGSRDGELALINAVLNNRVAKQELKLHRSGGQNSGELSVSIEGKDFSLEFPIQDSPDEVQHLEFVPYVLHQLARYAFREERGTKEERQRMREIYTRLSTRRLPAVPRPLSIAPIRTKPKPTYDLAAEEITPEGDHVPFLLRRYLGGHVSAEEKSNLQRALEAYGQEAGLFRKINVRSLGSRPSDPFPIQVTGSGQPANLAHVGYGVSQVLPVVVQSVLSGPPQLLLLQQPEVHLHPRAQAALGSFFVELVTGARRWLVVETHSDYVVDRIRQEVAAEKLKPDMVQILYFEKKASETTIYPLHLDECANILGAPPSYRQFFLREELALLRRSAK